MRSFKLKNISWGVLAVEAAAIFLSVLLGFSVNAWREGRRDDETRHQALESFRAELADNQREVAARLPYHREVLGGFRALMADPTERTFVEAIREAGFRGPQAVFLQQTALRTADATGALALMDFPTAKAVTAVYELQHVLGSAQDGLANAALNPALFSSDNVQASSMALMTYFDMVVEYEGALMNAYPDVLAHLDARLGRPPAEDAPEEDADTSLAPPDPGAVPSTP